MESMLSAMHRRAPCRAPLRLQLEGIAMTRIWSGVISH